jgi:CheY-like chemotaxis protein
MSATKAALRQFEALQPDAVVIDLALRAGTGLGLIQSIRRRQGERRPLLIVLTNYTQPTIASACLKAGADHFLDKSREIMRVHLARRRHSVLRGGRADLHQAPSRRRGPPTGKLASITTPAAGRRLQLEPSCARARWRMPAMPCDRLSARKFAMPTLLSPSEAARHWRRA